MRAVYRNPKELATAVKDLVDEFQDNLLTEDKFQERLQKISWTHQSTSISINTLRNLGITKTQFFEFYYKKK